MSKQPRRTSVRVNTDVDVDVRDITEDMDTDDLIEILCERTLSDKQIKALRKSIPVRVDDDELDEARTLLARGHIADCLIHIERALPATFSV